MTRIEAPMLSSVLTPEGRYTHRMSKRLQVVMSDAELEEIRSLASERGVTVSEWVREALRLARRERSTRNTARRLAAVRAGSRHAFPTGDIDQMLREIERGYQ